MAGEQDIDFREQLERVTADPHITAVTLTLLSGDKYFVVAPDEIIYGSRVVTIVMGQGGEVFFPFDAICNVDVRYK